MSVVNRLPLALRPEQARDALSTLKCIEPYKPFVVTFLAYLLILQVGVCVLLMPVALSGRPDFRHLYTAGYMLRSGYAHELYNPIVNHELQTKLAGPLNIPFTFDHLAYEALFFAPFSFLSFKSAYILFFGLDLGLIAACIGMLNPYTSGLRVFSKWLPATIALCFYPVTSALIQGQDSILMLTLVIVAFLLHQKKHDFSAGIFVGLTLFKFQYGIPIFILFLAWKWWRSAIGFLTSAVAVSGLSVWIAGFAGTLVYLKSLLSMSVGMKTGQQESFLAIHPSLMPNLRGLFSVLAGPYTSHFWIQVVTVVASVLLIFMAARKRPSFSLAIIVAVLVSYHGLIHDATLLVLPIGLLGAASLEGSWAANRWIIGLLCMILAGPTFLMQAGGSSYWMLALPLCGILTVAVLQETREASSSITRSPKPIVTSV